MQVHVNETEIMGGAAAAINGVPVPANNRKTYLLIGALFTPLYLI